MPEEFTNDCISTALYEIIWSNGTALSPFLLILWFLKMTLASIYDRLITIFMGLSIWSPLAWYLKSEVPYFFKSVEFILSISPSNEVIEQYFCKQNLSSHWHLSNTSLEPEFHISQLCPSNFRNWLERMRKNEDDLELTVIILVHSSLSSLNYIFEHGLILVFSFTYVNIVSIQGECFYVYR